jgi:hypothetical protein
MEYENASYPSFQTSGSRTISVSSLSVSDLQPYVLNAFLHIQVLTFDQLIWPTPRNYLLPFQYIPIEAALWWRFKKKKTHQHLNVAECTQSQILFYARITNMAMACPYIRSYLETIIQELPHVATHKCVMQAAAASQHDQHIHSPWLKNQSEQRLTWNIVMYSRTPVIFKLCSTEHWWSQVVRLFQYGHKSK